MKQSGILFIGKKIIKSLMLTSALLVSAQADFLMTLTDKDGVEESLCVKSYSFSNNLVSLHNKSGQYIDEYSTTKEVLTNKTWDGKPVYRRVFANLTGMINDGQWRSLNFNNASDNIENLVDAEVKIGNFHEHYTLHASKTTQFRYYINKNSFGYITTESYANSSTPVTVVLEYTKTTDTAQSNTNELTTLVHYLPSDSTNGGYITKSTKNLKIGFFENYTYDASTNSCIAPAN